MIYISYDAALGYFPVPSNRRPVIGVGQITLVARNISTGAIYVVWYDDSVKGFRIGMVLGGSAPTQGQTICVQFY